MAGGCNTPLLHSLTLITKSQFTKSPIKWVLYALRSMLYALCSFDHQITDHSMLYALCSFDHQITKSPNHRSYALLPALCSLLIPSINPPLQRTDPRFHPPR